MNWTAMKNQNWVTYDDDYRNFLTDVVSAWGWMTRNPVETDWSDIRSWSVGRLQATMMDYNQYIEATLFYGNSFCIEWLLPILHDFRDHIERELIRRSTPGRKRSVGIKNFVRSETVLQNIKPEIVYLQILEDADVSVSRRRIAAKCPFHAGQTGKSPPLHIWLDNGKWKCYSCGANGSIFDFVMKLENIEFVDAVKRVAELGGYQG